MTRNDLIKEKYKNGAKIYELSKEFKITRQRIDQILKGRKPVNSYKIGITLCASGVKKNFILINYNATT